VYTGDFCWITGKFSYELVSGNKTDEENLKKLEQEYIKSHNFRYTMSKNYDSEKYEEFDHNKDAVSYEEIIDYIKGL